MMRNRRTYRIRSIAAKTAIVYAIVGCLWILFSDRLLEKVVSSMDQVMLLQTYKGWFYVAITAFLIYMLVLKDLRKLDSTNTALKESYFKLEETNEKLVQVENSLILSEERYRIAIEGSSDGIWDWDIKSNRLYLSLRVNRILEISADVPPESMETVNELSDPNDIRTILWRYKKCLEGSSNHCTSRFRIRTSDNTFKWLSVRGKLIYDADGIPVRMTGALTDITESIAAEERIRQLAYYDVLTGLPNRQFFIEQLNTALLQPDAASRKPAVLYLDLDDFKSINDTLGHDLGDKLIQAVGSRLISILPPDCLISRLGGDDFLMLLQQTDSKEHAWSVADNLLSELKKAFYVEYHELYITASIGIAAFPDDGKDSKTLIRNVDTALNAAKEKGRNGCQTYIDEMNQRVQERMEVENSLRNALLNNEFRLHYQPQVDIHTGNIIGMEALIRWQHSKKGLVPPLKFLPVAEDTGLIVPIGEWVLHTACIQGKKWSDRSDTRIKMSVNLSANQFRTKELLDTVIHVLDSTGIDPLCLNVEITESIAMEDLEYTTELLRKLKQLGITISLDDFGTGYSSLSYLMQLPIDVLKMDKAFIDNITKDKRVQAIAKSIIKMAHSLDILVTAEGVETQEQLEFLRQHDCDAYQGYYYSRPLPEHEIERLLQSETGTWYR